MVIGTEVISSQCLHRSSPWFAWSEWSATLNWALGRCRFRTSIPTYNSKPVART